jgi:hypothetical protein
MTPEEEIRLEASTRPTAQFRRVCPYCGGGSTKEASMTVYVGDRGDVAWKCFRASCGVSGGSMQPGRATVSVTRPYNGESRSIRQYELEELEAKYGPLYSHLTVDVDSGRILLPVRGPDEQHRGYIARDMTGELTPKTLTYKAIDEPFIHWSRTMGKVTDLVIVEDWFSAERVGDIDEARSVALNGTHMSPGALEEILTEGKNLQIHVALDRDAFAKGLKMAYDIALLVSRPVFTWRLDKDLKYVRPDRIERALREREFDFISNH